MMDYYNFCAPNLPAHSNSPIGAMGLRNKFTLSTVQSPLFPDTPSDHDSTEQLSPGNGLGGITEYSKLVPVVAGHNNHKTTRSNVSNTTALGSMKSRSSSCDCLDSHSSTDTAPSALDSRSDSSSILYDRLAPQPSSAQLANTRMHDSLDAHKCTAKSASSSPDILSNSINKHFQYDRKVDYLHREHLYDYIGVDLEAKPKSRSGSNSPIPMGDWTDILPFGIGRQKSKKSAESNKMTKTQSRKKHLPLQDSKRQILIDSEQSKYDPDLIKSHSLEPSRQNSEDGSRIVEHRSQPPLVKQSIVHSLELGSSIESFSHDQLSSGSNSSIDLNVNHHHNHHKKPEVLPRTGTHGAVSLKSLTNKTEEESNAAQTSSNQTSDEPPPIPKKQNIKSATMARNHHEPVESPPLPRRSNSEYSGSSLRSQTNKGPNDPCSYLPPRPIDPRFTIQLPQAQFNFRPPPPPRPRVLCGSGTDQLYTAVSFSDGTESSAPQKELTTRVPPSLSKMPQSSELGSYVAVDFQVTAGLMKTSEQVALDHREYLEGVEQAGS